MSQDFSGMRGMTYECVRCGYLAKGEELGMREQIKCPECGYRVLRKIRPPIVKRIKAI